MTVVDAHLHFWDPTRFRYPWLAGYLDRPFLPDDLDLGESGVSRAVFVQADCLVDEAIAEARWAAGFEVVAGIVAYAPIEQPYALGRWLDEVGDVPHVRGVRRNLQSEPGSFFEHPDLVAGLRSVAARGLSFDACVTWRQLRLLANLVAQVPDLVVVLDHLGKPPVASSWNSDDSASWNRDLRDLARSERVTVKLSGLSPEAGPRANLSIAARPYLDTALDAFGAERCMVGSDWPVSMTVPEHRSYDGWFGIALTGLSDDEYPIVGSRTAMRVYRLDTKE